MGTTAEKMTYLNTTKVQIKDGINRLGGELTNLSTFRSYAEALENVYNALPKVTGEGSSLSLTPTRKGGLTIIPKGACEQESYSGKNLIGLKDGTYGTASITAVVNNGVITLNGTTTGVIMFSIPCNTNYSGISVDTNFIISLNNSEINSNVSIRLNPQGSYDANCSTTNKTQLRTLVEDRPLYTEICSIRVGANTTLTNFVLQPQIELGSTATSWEPYVGGIPSPNPDYPQDIRVVTGDNSVVVQNKNVFNYATFPDLIVQENGSVKASKGFTYVDSKIFKGKPNTQYTISFRNLNNELDYTGFSCGFPSYVNITATGYYTFTTDENGEKEYRVGARGNSVANLYEAYIQIEEGTQPTSYIAHQEQTYTLHLGTNYLAGIDTYKDEIVCKTDEWKIVREAVKIRLPNNKGGYNSGNNWYYISVTDLGLISPYLKSVISTHFTYYDINTFTASNSLNGISISSAGTYILIRNTNCTSEAEYRTFLSNNNVDVIAYKEAEETITNQTLITDLNNMYQAMGYDGTTNITITSDTSNAQMIASVSALKGE